MSSERTRISTGEMARGTPEERRRAARRVATGAASAADCALLLDALGLTVHDGMETP